MANGEYEVVGSSGMVVRVLAQDADEAIETALLVAPDLGEVVDVGDPQVVGFEGENAE